MNTENQSEKELQSQILKALRKLGFLAWKNDVQGVRCANGRVKNPNAGMPDICAVEDGITHYIEVKSKTGKLSKSQINWHMEAYKHGVIVHVIDSFDTFKSIFGFVE